MELAAEGVVTMNESRTGNRLRGFNAGMAVLHAAQGAAILALSNGVTAVRRLWVMIAGSFSSRIRLRPRRAPHDSTSVAGPVANVQRAGSAPTRAACARSSAGVSCSGSNETETRRIRPRSRPSLMARWTMPK